VIAPFRRLVPDSSGAVAPIIALSLFGLIAVGGIAFDYARLATLDTELQDAADQAALAGATQLDGQDGAVRRAAAAAQGLLKNQTFMGNDKCGTAIETGVTSTSLTNNVTDAYCIAHAEANTTRIFLYSNKADAEAEKNPLTVTSFTALKDASDANAHFIRVAVVKRRAEYALTPIVGALSSGNNATIGAEAVAGVASAICKTPPIMICNPEPGVPFNANNKRGFGIQATGHGNDRSGIGTPVTAWAPGDFGFLAVGNGQNSDLMTALAFQNPPFDCYSTTTANVTSGNPQGLYDAVNTRFDIYDFSSGNGTTLAPCFSGSCPSASNVVKDLVKPDTQTNGNKCKISNTGWQLPNKQFSPRAYSAADTAMSQIDADKQIDAMGLPRDNCHYNSYSSTCANGRIGDGKWARGDYFNKYHLGNTPINASTMTRYETYLWEINAGGASRIPNAVSAGGGLNQYSTGVCSTGTISSGTDRRVISVALVENCASLNGTSQPVTISNWVDMFMVEPTVGTRGNGSSKDSIYLEVIGNTKASGNGSVSAQKVRHDVPYLVR
jgi:Flp pilus assembly protein TadG